MSSEEPRIPETPEEAMEAARGQTAPAKRPGERVKAAGKRVLDEIEATPIVGDAYDWLRAVALGVKDTAIVMRDEARRGTREAESERWRTFDDKTRYRRRK